MQKTKIEWVRNPDGSQGYTSNPVKGLCPMACPYCYARAMYKRFKWNETIRFVPEEMAEWSKAKDGSNIFIGSTIELFGEWVQEHWLKFTFDHVKMYPNLTFVFLTKCPWNLPKWSPFPENTYVGVSVTNQAQYDNALKYLAMIEAPVKFLSFEPLLERINLDL